MNKFDLSEKLKEELIKRNLFEQEDDKEEDQDEETSEDTNENEGFCEMICHLLHSQTQVHIFHLGTKSYAEHKALQRYYEGIDALVDGIIESFQGKYGLVTNYETYDMDKFESVKKCISYFNDLNKMITDKRKSVKDSYIQNQIDTVQELLFSTVYKLKFLS
jgi:hypothetical protein